ncbi:MAG: hypothetical protein ACKO43_03765, partial [Alphaproteobacteria bacterium]
RLISDPVPCSVSFLQAFFKPCMARFPPFSSHFLPNQPNLSNFARGSRDFFFSETFPAGEITNGHTAAYKQAIATSAQNGTEVSPSFSGFLKFLCSGSVVSQDKFLTFADVAQSHRKRLKSPLLVNGGDIYDDIRDSMTNVLREGIINPNNFLLKARDTSESLALNRALIRAFNSSCCQSGLLNCELGEDVEIRHDHIKLPANSKGGDLDAMLLELDDRITDAWRYAAIMVLEVLDDNEVLKPLKGTELGQLIVQEVQAKCITGFLTVDLLTRPIGQQARDALRQEISASAGFLSSLESPSSSEELAVVVERAPGGMSS